MGFDGDELWCYDDDDGYTHWCRAEGRYAL